ncbi:MAG: MFS transporter [Archaeoglobales archaeon]|nr:MFS transporter [Archaeoglobales archaeon]
MAYLAQKTRYRWLMLMVLSLLYFLAYFHRTSSAVVAKTLMSEFAVSALAISLMASLYFYPYAFMQVPVGFLSDTVGARRTVTVFTFVAFLGCVLFSIATEFNIILIARTLIGIGVSGVFIPAVKVISRWFEKNEFATALGTFKTFGALGAVTSGYFLALMVVIFGWRSTFAILALFTIILAFLCFFLIKDYPKNDPKVSSEKLDFKDTAKIILKSRYFWIFASFQFFLNGALMGFQGLWGGPYLMDVYKLDEVGAGKILTTIGIGLLFGAPAIGLLSDRVLQSRKIALSAFSLIFMLSWIPLAFFTASLSKEVLYVVCFTMGFTGSVVVIVNTMIKEIFPLSITGTAASSVNIFPFIGGAIFQMLMGFIIESFDSESYSAFSYSVAFKLCFLGALIAFICSLLTRETYEKVN